MVSKYDEGLTHKIYILGAERASRAVCLITGLGPCFEQKQSSIWANCHSSSIDAVTHEEAGRVCTTHNARGPTRGSS